jgi:uncharacterized protein YkwD
MRVNSFIDAMFVLLNEYRQQQGVAPLTYDLQLEAAIQGHCRHMVEHPFGLDHIAPEQAVREPWDRAELCGTTANAENLAQSRSGNPEDVMDMWKGSSGHNANMLSSSSTRVGICNYGDYWGQIFGR